MKRAKKNGEATSSPLFLQMNAKRTEQAQRDTRQMMVRVNTSPAGASTEGKCG